MSHPAWDTSLSFDQAAAICRQNRGRAWLGLLGMVSRLHTTEGEPIVNYRLNEAGEPVREPDILSWASWFETADRTVARDQVGDADISTVFLGMDHSFTPEGPPVLYETMIFGGRHDEYQERYSSRQQALAGHAAAVELAKATG